MNRILPTQGTVTARGDTQMAEANRSQQQRFEQAMRLDQEQKTAHQHRENNLHQSRVPLHQQLLQAQQQKKEIADKAQQQELATTHGRSKKQQPEPLVKEEQLGISLSEVAARDQKETERQADKHSQDKELEDCAHLSLEAWSLPGQKSSQSTSSSAQEKPSAYSDKGTDNTLIAGDTSGLDRALVTEKAAQQLNEASLVDARELAEPLAADTDTDINALTLSNEMPEASGQPIPPQVKTPGDLQLARLAPAENNRELGQLLERLAVDIYQELGRPERPPLLRLTLPQLGDLSIRIAHHHGELQIEILATAQGELLLNQGRSDLVDRLQRLYPGERVALDLFGQPDSEQGSRHKRSIYEEWDADA
ncbi:type III secretion system needle length determinant [Aeromonas veronii]|nr:type III secretion system needle length determinant [Aeromonas veronii]MCJ8213040.1 type III secretion system needle length determinant [Aeromonas veronii]